MSAPLSPVHPLTRSSWIWPHGNLYLQNCHAQFRHDFTLEEVPVSAPLYLTADQSYRLYVNGRYVCRGPARGYQESWPFDKVDIAAFLAAGHNWISVEAYNPGIGTFQYIHRSAAGFLCAAEWGNTRIHTNRRDWRMRRAPGNRADVARLSVQMAFQEDFDAALDDSSWITAPEPPAWTMEPYYYLLSEIPFGRPPWTGLEPRGIPMLREDRLAPERIAVYGVGRMKDGWRDCRNIAWLWAGDEERSVPEWRDGATLSQHRSADRLTFAAPPVGEGEFLAVSIDLGAIRTGCFSLFLDRCSGGEAVDCLYCQYLENGIPETRIPVGNGGLLALATRLRTAKGRCGRDFYSIFGARYVVLILRGFRETVRVETSWRTAEYPFAMRGRFETSDRELNTIHALCRHTQQICSTDAYIDTPWREQGQWWADARIQARNTFYLDGDSRLLRRGIDSIAGQRTAHGLVPGVAPSCSGGCIIPDFALTWVLTVWDHYWQTGSMEAFERHRNRIRAVFDYFDTPETRSENGILTFDSRCWLFEDWADLPKSGCPAFLNLWHLYALLHYEKLLRASGRIAEADDCAGVCRSRAALLEEFFFDETEGLFLAGRDLNGTALKSPSVHDQVLAVLTGLRPDAWPRMVRKRLLPFLRGEETPFAVPTSFWCSYLFDAAELLGLQADALAFIRRHWSRMIPFGGTWERLEFQESDGQSCCHAWSAHPAVHLVNLLFGIRSLAPGWREIELAPKRALLPDSGEILLPLPPGDLRIHWRAGTVRVEAPDGMTVRSNVRFE